MRLVLLITALLFAPAASEAGAWPREVGKTFVALSFSGAADPLDLAAGEIKLDGYTAAYLEHGLTPRLTVGIDAGRGDGGSYSALAFARYPVGPTGGKTIYALKAGVGHSTLGGQGGMVAALGLDIGRGISTDLGNGWLGLESWASYNVRRQSYTVKADLTAGLTLNDHTKVMVQMQLGRNSASGSYVRLAPSIVRRFGKSTSVELGVQAGLIGDRKVAIKLGTWLEF